jgi:hypothetical protein
MFACLLKRAIPFTLTLLVGSGLGSIFSSTSPSNERSMRLSATTITSRHSCGSRHRAVAAPQSTPVVVTFEPIARPTEAAQRNHTRGMVSLLVQFGADGKAKVVDHITTLPDGLTEEAERVVKGTAFNPATINGVPYTVTEVRRYTF